MGSRACRFVLPDPCRPGVTGPVHQHDTGRLRAGLQRVPDPRSRRGRWYPLAGLLLVCACTVVSGARTITEITAWGQRATTTVLKHLGIRRHLPGRRRAPSHATLTRLLAALDGDALDAAISTYLAGHNHTDARHHRPTRQPPSVRCWNPSIRPEPWPPSTPCTASRTRCAGSSRKRRPTASR
ncbi:transposase family protein [Streptomyces sp. NBC_00289]|uniref:transposase family protein n=1 Tax=Streptomyces sp. NBC_00289 TaxID=2975703 RepID=UPI00324A497F